MKDDNKIHTKYEIECEAREELRRLEIVKQHEVDGILNNNKVLQEAMIYDINFNHAINSFRTSKQTDTYTWMKIVYDLTRIIKSGD